MKFTLDEACDETKKAEVALRQGRRADAGKHLAAAYRVFQVFFPCGAATLKFQLYEGYYQRVYEKYDPAPQTEPTMHLPRESFIKAPSATTK
ncbi:MAG TPA: hypothetical protein VLJ21_04135 [Candidatus Binatia bacterium]|nr:hypothetical protein [Candidatus Binatia bacterium]